MADDVVVAPAGLGVNHRLQFLISARGYALRGRFRIPTPERVADRGGESVQD
ncbi:MAG: hypothetical protein Tsb0010_19850 [Parvularculaceae bacterium]